MIQGPIIIAPLARRPSNHKSIWLIPYTLPFARPPACPPAHPPAHSPASSPAHSWSTPGPLLLCDSWATPGPLLGRSCTTPPVRLLVHSWSAPPVRRNGKLSMDRKAKQQNKYGSGGKDSRFSKSGAQKSQTPNIANVHQMTTVDHSRAKPCLHRCIPTTNCCLPCIQIWF